ncbi:D(2) dopamine receptor-like [Biomphalaria glabrata]|uniref:D(2) dopamine receptor-like n=1 Tax=Biomphalaria glabrata TaxID=6526 RepID=A0A9U8EPJ1_BIOGL|nr:D(2) dopamine receptor-like [Biomphalaria glabrata]KAI8779046.1 D(2) dopamine receptor-like isoform X1 [Biomphalaria glabrata]
MVITQVHKLNLVFTMNGEIIDNFKIETSNRNYSTEEIKEYLSALQHESTLAFIPALIYLSLLIVVGSIGNCLVLIVYLSKMAITPLRIFIISMAIFDLPTTILVIPGEMYDMLHVWDFDEPLFCKVRRYLNAAIVLSSVFALVAIASTRHRMVCDPLRHQWTVKQAKVASCILATAAFILTIPYGIIHGTQTIKTPNPQISGHFCEVDDLYVLTIWPNVNSAFFILVFIICSLTMSVFYVCIGRQTWQQGNKQRRGFNAKSYNSTTNPSESFISTTVRERKEMKCRFEEKNKISYLISPHIRDEPSMTESVDISQMVQQIGQSEVSLALSHSITPNARHNKESEISVSGIDIMSDSNATLRKQLHLSKSKRRDRNSTFGKTSRMMFTISLLFVLGFVPFLALNFFKTAAPESHAALSGVSLSFYHLFLRLYLINSAINPIVYSLLDRRFRRKCIHLIGCWSQ